MENKLPKNWVETDLEHLFNLVYGKGLSVSELLDEGFDVYGANGIIGKYDKFTYEKSKIIISCRGAASGVIHKTNPKSFITSNSIVLDEISDTLLNLDFVKYAMTIADKSDVITGTAQPQITIQLLKYLSFPLPPLAEQNRIVAKLDTLFAKLETIKASMAKVPLLLKDFRQQVLTQAVTGKLTEEWRKGRDLEEWQQSSIGKLFDVKTGATPKRGEKKYYEEPTIPWLKSGQVKNELIFEADEFISELAVKETNAKIYPIDTILVAMYGEGKTRGQVGWMKIKAASNQAIAALVNEKLDLITKKYVYNFCLSQYNEIRAQAEGGNQPNLNLSKIKNWSLKLPSFKEQQEIVSRVESLFAKADAIEKQYETLKAKIESLPQAILHKAFKGELTEQLNTDGDAKELLREIEGLKKEQSNLKKKGKKVKV